MNSTQVSAPDERITRSVDAFRRIVRALRLAAQRTQAESGLSAAQLFVLTALAQDCPCSLTELGAQTHTDRTSVRDIVSRLAAQGLVHRTRSELDRRQASVELTEAGRALLADAPMPPTALLIEGMALLSAAERDGLSASLERLVQAMGIAGTPAEMLFSDPAPRASTPSDARRVRAEGGHDG